MDVEQAVKTFGTDAVIKYRDVAAIKKDEPEYPTCLSLSIASSLITDCHLDARVEVAYSRVLGDEPTASALATFRIPAPAPSVVTLTLRSRPRRGPPRSHHARAGSDTLESEH
jgi:hypothetical protein